MRKLSSKKIVSLLMIIALIGGIFVFCVNAEEKIDLSMYDVEDSITFEEALSVSNCIVKGEYVKRWNYDSHYEEEFLVKDVIKGTTDDQVIFVFGEHTSAENVCASHADSIDHAVYKAGEEYWLVLERWTSVYDEHDRYYAYDKVISTNEWKVKNEGADNLKASLNQIKRKRAAVEVYGGEYTNSADIKEIGDFSDVVVLVEAEELFYESDIMNTQTYRCTVIEDIQGKAEDQEIFMVVFEGTVEIGEQYVAMLKQADENSLVYTLAAKENAIMVSDELDIIEKLLF